MKGDGSINLDGLYDKKYAPKKRGDEDLHNPFVGSSSYQ